MSERPPSSPTNATHAVLVVLTTAPSAGVAEALARGAVEARLAACVNIVEGLRSIYRWEGATCDEREVQLVFKTTSDRAGALRAFIEREHPYDVPEILAVPVDEGASGAAYLRFVRESG